MVMTKKDTGTTNIRFLTSNNLSYYRTLHRFERYGEITKMEDLKEYCKWAQENKVKVYILGNGSNTLFTRRSIQTLVLKNKLPKSINPLPDNRLEVSSSAMVLDVLKYCYEKSLDSFYYLASVPATIGGALAMNAGRGMQYGCTIFDFVESVTFFDGECVKTLTNAQIQRSYRETIFTGQHSLFILSAIFKFEHKEFEESPIIARYRWSKENQDNTAPNCGSVFKLSNPTVLSKLKGISVGKACFSQKTNNWILNRSESSLSIVLLIQIARFVHFLTRKQIALELIRVD